ncbi:hypothetical protein [Mucilaginibacter myungsuensis]|uniref:Uncharacterized protein n=1 Tax=Mucilaginibacter myungsuensis TaxID=649104 RepID=A0A929L0P7_9SPHI|nr:hypothetical protein [Mucilaginibacter myungsuensis]MBE9664692.1 hypothetical protein [Mucilaginibacter myungsuensis]MDN3601451.1 hypothetical protein [Mucilaginibacter myungsuensis]
MEANNNMENESYGFDPNEVPERNPNETPERDQADNEGTGYSQQQEVQQNNDGSDTSYTEQNDVTPPEKHEFPSEGRATGNFQPSDHGRSTGRMVGHEPGTEGI